MNLDKSKWKKVRLGDVVFEKKTAVDAKTCGLERYIAGEHMASEDLHLRTWGTIGDDYLGPAFHRKFEKGDILYGSRRTYLKKVAIADFDGVTANTTFVLTENTDLVVPGFIPFLMLSDVFTEHSVRNSKGSVNPYINYKDIAQFQFLLPPKDQQARLAELLWAGDAVVEGYGKLLAELQKSKVSYMRWAFGDLSNKQTIKEIAKVTSGGTPDRKIKTFWNGDIPWIKTTEIDYKDIYESEEFISEEGLRGSAAKIIPKDSLLMAMYGQGVTRGRVARLRIDSTVNQACAAIILNEKRDLDFLYYYLQYSYEAIRELAQGANQQNLNGEIIKNIEVPYPNIESRVQIGQKLKELDGQLYRVEILVNRTKEITSSLLNQIFTP